LAKSLNSNGLSPISALLITYYLNVPGQNYDKLYEKIKGLGSWWHHFVSTWVVDSTLTVGEVNDRLRSVLDDSDSVFVLNITGDTYAGWLTQDAWGWIKNHA
jgi:hypothetical protein